MYGRGRGMFGMGNGVGRVQTLIVLVCLILKILDFLRFLIFTQKKKQFRKLFRKKDKKK